jgi:16S rRNA (guanine(966)-N(2))-methyltransferase RsmD
MVTFFPWREIKVNSKTSKKQRILRPTTGKVREALFNILRSKIEKARFLDLYAGTGSIGMSAINQGASEVVFVEEGKSNIKKINQLVNKYRISEKTTVVTKKVLSFIEWAELNQSTFDIIFLDPPYHTDEIFHALSAIGRSNILDTDGIVIAEHFTKKKLPDKVEKLQKTTYYKYGDTLLSFYTKK